MDTDFLISECPSLFLNFFFPASLIFIHQGSTFRSSFNYLVLILPKSLLLSYSHLIQFTYSLWDHKLLLLLHIGIAPVINMPFIHSRLMQVHWMLMVPHRSPLSFLGFTFFGNSPSPSSISISLLGVNMISQCQIPFHDMMIVTPESCCLFLRYTSCQTSDISRGLSKS